MRRARSGTGRRRERPSRLPGLRAGDDLNHGHHRRESRRRCRHPPVASKAPPFARTAPVTSASGQSASGRGNATYSTAPIRKQAAAAKSAGPESDRCSSTAHPAAGSPADRAPKSHMAIGTRTDGNHRTEAGSSTALARNPIKSAAFRVRTENGWSTARPPRATTAQQRGQRPDELGYAPPHRNGDPSLPQRRQPPPCRRRQGRSRALPRRGQRPMSPANRSSAAEQVGDRRPNPGHLLFGRTRDEHLDIRGVERPDVAPRSK